MTRKKGSLANRSPRRPVTQLISSSEDELRELLEQVGVMEKARSER